MSTFKQLFKQFTESSEPYVHQPSGITYYYKDGFKENGGPKDNILHRKGDPAIIAPANGAEYWYEDNQLHRIGGPAVIRDQGIWGGKQWWARNKLHREDGLAVILPNNGGFQWWINGKRITDKEFNEQLKRKEIKADIQGHKNNRFPEIFVDNYL